MLRRSDREHPLPGKLKDLIMLSKEVLFKFLPESSANPGSESIVESNTEDETAQQSLMAKNRKKLCTKRTSDDPPTPDEALTSDESIECSALIKNENWKLADRDPASGS